MQRATSIERTERRRAFPSWSVEIPVSFEETFVHEGSGYWHAWDDSRSVSLTSVRLTEHGKAVPADAIVRQMSPAIGRLSVIEDLPPGIAGHIGEGAAEPGSRASKLVSGFLAINGCALVLTITADDVAWSKAVLRSIRGHQIGH